MWRWRRRSWKTDLLFAVLCGSMASGCRTAHGESRGPRPSGSRLRSCPPGRGPTLPSSFTSLRQPPDALGCRRCWPSSPEQSPNAGRNRSAPSTRTQCFPDPDGGRSGRWGALRSEVKEEGLGRAPAPGDMSGAECPGGLISRQRRRTMRHSARQRSIFSGSVTSTANPGSALRSDICPPCACATSLHRYSPSPTPPVDRWRAVSTR